MMYFCVILHCLGLAKYVVTYEGHTGYRRVLSLLVAILHCCLALRYFFFFNLPLVIIVHLLL